MFAWFAASLMSSDLVKLRRAMKLSASVCNTIQHEACQFKPTEMCEEHLPE